MLSTAVAAPNVLRIPSRRSAGSIRAGVSSRHGGNAIESGRPPGHCAADGFRDPRSLRGSDLMSTSVASGQMPIATPVCAAGRERTFEGRDRFAPAAAWLATGVDLGALGPRAD